MDITKRDFSAKLRRKLAATGAAMPGGAFPIKTKQDVENAVHDIGRAKDPAAAKAHIIERAKAIGATSALPDGWTAKSDHQLSEDAMAEEIKKRDERIAKRMGAVDDALTALVNNLQGAAGKPKAEQDPVLDDIFKSFNGDLKKAADDGAGSSDFNSILHAQAIQQAVGQVMSPMYDMSSALRQSIGSILNDDAVADKSAKVRESIDQFKDAIISLVEVLEETVGAGEDDGTGVAKDDGDGSVDDDDDMSDDDVEKACGEAVEMIAKGLEADPEAVVPVDRVFLANVATLLQVPIAKRGARHSATDMGHLSEIHKCAGEIMKRCGALGASMDSSEDVSKGKNPDGTDKGDGGTKGGGDGAGAGDQTQEATVAKNDAGSAGDQVDIAKALGDMQTNFAKGIEDLGKTIVAATEKKVDEAKTEFAKAFEGFEARLKKVEAEPVPAVGVKTVVTDKAGDIGTAGDIAKADASDPAKAPDALESMRRVQAGPAARVA